MAEELSPDIMEDIAGEVEELNVDVLREELKSMLVNDEKRKVKQQAYNATPEAQAKRKNYYDKTKDQRREYQKKRAARQKLILQRAKEAGLEASVRAEMDAEASRQAEADMVNEDVNAENLA